MRIATVLATNRVAVVKTLAIRKNRSPLCSQEFFSRGLFLQNPRWEQCGKARLHPYGPRRPFEPVRNCKW